MFDITTSRDFLWKLEADFDAFEKELHSASLALNCALSAYHLHEWVWGDWLKTDYATWRVLGIRDKDSFLGWIDRAFPWFSTIQELANGAKHFQSVGNFKTERVGAPPLIIGEVGVGVGAIGEPVPYVAETQGNGYLLIDYGPDTAEHRWKTAASLIEAVVRFWREFFFRYHPSPEVRAEVREFRLIV